jgi:hypothetical protein
MLFLGLFLVTMSSPKFLASHGGVQNHFAQVGDKKNWEPQLRKKKNWPIVLTL